MNNNMYLVKNEESAEPGAHKNDRNLEETSLIAGAIISLIMLQSICFIYGGIIPLIMSALSTIVGAGLGLLKFYRFPYRPISCISKERSLIDKTGETFEMPKTKAA